MHIKKRTSEGESEALFLANMYPKLVYHRKEYLGMSNIYELTNEYLQLMDMMENEELDPQVLADTMEGIEGEFEIKADNYARVKAGLEGTVEAIKTEEKRLADRRRAIEKNITSLMKNLQNAMVLTGKTKFKTDFYSFGVQNNPPSVVVDADIEAIPEDYIKIKKEIDKTAIKDALKKGETFDFAHLEVTQGLRIR